MPFCRLPVANTPAKTLCTLRTCHTAKLFNVQIRSGGGHKVVYLTHSRGGGVFSFSNLGKYTGLQCTKWVGVRTNPEKFLSIDVLIRTFLTKSQSFFNNFLKLYDSYF